MGIIRDPRAVKPICGVTFTNGIDLSELIQQLEAVLGPVEERTSIFDFSYTNYYQEEMGSELSKVFLSFIRLIHPGNLARIKKKTNEIEKTWCVEGKRWVNLDPGYITGAKLVLASTKDFAHRIFLSNGIYGDVQLRFKYGRFRVNEWTYPDYQTDLSLSFFQKVRNKYIQQEKSHE